MPHWTELVPPAAALLLTLVLVGGCVYGIRKNRRDHP